jgi:hypothetical protein
MADDLHLRTPTAPGGNAFDDVMVRAQEETGIVPPAPLLPDAGR